MPVLGGNAIDHGAKYKGMLADLQVSNVVSKLNKTGATIEYGLGVVSDGEDGMKVGTTGATAAEFIGVVQRELNRAYADGATFGAPDEFDGSVVTHGVVWVQAAVTVAKDEPVFLRIGATSNGNFSNAAGTGATESVEIVGAKWLTGAASGELAKISLGLGG